MGKKRKRNSGMLRICSGYRVYLENSPQKGKKEKIWRILHTHKKPLSENS
jgi:hypothetical protein